MAKDNESNKARYLWPKDINDSDFYNESNLSDEDLGEHDLSAMTIFSQNVNLLRHLPRLQDSLKPVERRIIYAMFNIGILPTSKPRKSQRIVGDAMFYHPHGDQSIYKTVVGLAQPWKNPLPLIHGIGNFGDDLAPDGYAQMRYTEAKLSKYAYDCFFKDFDSDCIETIFNTAADAEEPLALPSRYPNILINGGFGIAMGNAFCIPPFNIIDIVKLCKRLIHDPNHPDIYINPDLPTSCDIVDNGSLREICETGNGVLRMRAKIDIEEDPKRPNVWVLRVKSLPWMASISSIEQALVKLTKEGILPIKDIQDESYPIITKDAEGVEMDRKVIDYKILINKAHDPKVIRNKLYAKTELSKSISVNFKVVEDALSIGRLNMRDLVLAWLDTRREYKRRLLNKRIVKINARLSFIDILLVLTSEDHAAETIRIVTRTNSENAVEALMKHAHMSSFQATKVMDLKVNGLTPDARLRYIKEKETLRDELDRIMKSIKNPKSIDEEIMSELDELLKYASSRRSAIIESESGIQVSNTNHFVTITKLGMLKKLPYNPNSNRKTPALGVFKTNDYPVHGIVINNHDSIVMMDSLGRYSCIPVHTIENNESSQYGSIVYDIAKLNGEIVSAFEYFSNDTEDFVKENIKRKVYVVTLTKNGYLKKTPMAEFNSSRSVKNAKAMKVREDDSLICGKILIDDGNMNIIIYTEKGQFSYISSDDIAEQSKDSMGLLSIKLDPDDACVGMCVIGNSDQYLLVVTDKGNMKKCELDYLGTPGKRKISSYVATLDVNDNVTYIDGIRDDDQVTVCTRTDYQDFMVENIPLKPRKSKCVKMISVPLGNNIINVTIQHHNKH
jgi:DNA gyrase subunit A